MKKHHVYGVGNALVDIEIEVGVDFLSENNIEKGLMTLVDESQQANLLNALGKSAQYHRRNCGGSAANTIIATRQLGGRCFYCCKVASDEMGDFYFEDLLSHGVETNLSGEREQGVTGRCLVFITPDADRTMNTYLGITSTLSENEIEQKELIDSEFVYLEGYLATSPSGKACAIKAREIAQKNNIKTSLTFSDPGVVEHFRQDFLDIMGDKKIDLVFCNESELLQFTQEKNLEDGLKTLKNYAHSFAVTRGPKGAVVYDGLRETYILSPLVNAIDTNGAGDLFAGAFLYGITNRLGFAESGRLACHLSSVLVTQFGARLKTSQVEEVKKLLL